MGSDVEGSVWLLRLVLEVDLREREHDALPRGVPSALTLVETLVTRTSVIVRSGTPAGPAGLANRDRRIPDVLTRGARLHQKRRRLVDVMGEVEVVEARLARRRHLRGPSCRSGTRPTTTTGRRSRPCAWHPRLTLDRADTREDRIAMTPP